MARVVENEGRIFVAPGCILLLFHAKVQIRRLANKTLSELIILIELLALCVYLSAVWWHGVIIFLILFFLLWFLETYQVGRKIFLCLRWVGSLAIAYLCFSYPLVLSGPLFVLVVFPFILEGHGIRVFRPLWRWFAFNTRRVLHKAGMRDHVNPIWNQAFDETPGDFVKPDDPIDGTWHKIE